MFTTAHLKRLRQTGKGHFGFTAVVVVAFAATLAVSLRLLDVWTAQTNHRVEAIAALGPDTRVLATGSSHVFATINPAHVKWTTMNLAAPVCSYVCVEGIVHGNLAKLPNLSVLVIEYDIVPLLYDTLDAYHGDYRQLLELQPSIESMHVSTWRKYELWRDQLVLSSIFAPLFEFRKFSPQEVINRLRGESDAEDSIIGPGFSNGPETMPPDDDGPARVARHLRESPGLSQLADNEAALARLIELAKARGVKVVLMRFPHHPGYWKAQPRQWQEVADGVLARLRKRFPGGFDYWDFGLLTELSEGDYRNGDHINDGATTRVTKLFEARLAPLMSGESQ